MPDYLIRGVPAEVWDKVKAKAASQHLTLKQAALAALEMWLNAA